MFLCFNSWALSLWSFFFYQFDESSGLIGFASILDSNDFFLDFGLLQLTLFKFGIRNIESQFSLPLPSIAEVSNTLIGFSSITFRSEHLSLRPSLVVEIRRRTTWRGWKRIRVCREVKVDLFDWMCINRP